MKNKIKITSDVRRHLSIIEVSGIVVPNELSKTIKSAYSEHTGMHSLWDFSGASLEALTPDSLKHMAGVAKIFSEKRRSVCTLLVAKDEDHVMLMKLYKELALTIKSDIKYQIFSSKSDALEFIDKNPSI